MRRKKGVQEGFNTFLNALFLFHFISKMFSFFLQSNSGKPGDESQLYFAVFVHIRRSLKAEINKGVVGAADQQSHGLQRAGDLLIIKGSLEPGEKGLYRSAEGQPRRHQQQGAGVEVAGHGVGGEPGGGQQHRFQPKQPGPQTRRPEDDPAAQDKEEGIHPGQPSGQPGQKGLQHRPFQNQQHPVPNTPSHKLPVGAMPKRKEKRTMAEFNAPQTASWRHAKGRWPEIQGKG